MKPKILIDQLHQADSADTTIAAVLTGHIGDTLQVWIKGCGAWRATINSVKNGIVQMEKSDRVSYLRISDISAVDVE